MLADKLPFPFAARMLLECARVMNMNIVWTVMGVLVSTVPSAFLPERRERFLSESCSCHEGLGREPDLCPITERRCLKP